jgi:L-erythro-3,5-diaminohexanoate dehydrogenase
VEPKGVLPQAAWRLDNDFSRVADDEILLDVDVLNIDSASFREMEARAGSSPDALARIVLETVSERGKQHNPVTGSGGMLLGRVARVGERLQQTVQVGAGAEIATLVSLTLTPLRIDAIRAVHVHRHQIEVTGQAVLFESGVWAPMPGDLPRTVALAAFDVCGAAPQVARRAKPGGRVVILGAGGKSGLLCAVMASERVGPQGLVLGIERPGAAADDLERLGVARVIRADATDAVAVYEAVCAETNGARADLVVSCVNVEGAEMSAILSARPRGDVYFFSMSTSFTRAALGAEGVGQDVDLTIGNGFCEGHAELTLGLLRRHGALREIFERRYGP